MRRSFHDDLEELKTASVRYVAAMKAALALSDDSDCSELIAKADDYAAAKVAYYTAARKAMPALLEMARGQKTNSRYGDELTEIFRGFGQDRDEEATGTLKAKLSRCPNSNQRDQARLAVEQAKETAEQLVRILAGWRMFDLCKRSSNQRSSSSTLQRDDPGSLQNYCLFA